MAALCLCTAGYSLPLKDICWLGGRQSRSARQHGCLATVRAKELQAGREAATQRGGYADRSLGEMKAAEIS